MCFYCKLLHSPLLPSAESQHKCMEPNEQGMSQDRAATRQTAEEAYFILQIQYKRCWGCQGQPLLQSVPEGIGLLLFHAADLDAELAARICWLRRRARFRQMHKVWHGLFRYAHQGCIRFPANRRDLCQHRGGSDARLCFAASCGASTTVYRQLWCWLRL